MVVVLLEADRPDFKAEGLPRLPVITGEEVDQWQLPKLRGSNLEDRLRLLVRLLRLAAVLKNVRLVVLYGELLLVVALQLDGVGVAGRAGVVPGGGVEAGVRKVLVRLLTHQPEECELDGPEGVVTDPEPAAQRRVPALLTLPPRDVWHPAGVDVREDAGLPARRHVAVHLHGVVRHPQVGVDPVETVGHLRMSIMQVLTGSSRTVPGTEGLLDLFQLNPDVVDVGVHRDEVDVLILLRSRFGL